MGKDRLCNSCAGELEKSNSEKMSDPLKVSTDNKDGGNEERKDFICADMNAQIASFYTLGDLVMVCIYACIYTCLSKED